METQKIIITREGEKTSSEKVLGPGLKLMFGVITEALQASDITTEVALNMGLRDLREKGCLSEETKQAMGVFNEASRVTRSLAQKLFEGLL